VLKDRLDAAAYFHKSSYRTCKVPSVTRGERIQS
jgi:hypothetical protein